MTSVTRWPEQHARRGVVASPHALASEAGLHIFRRGGNAVDAAIATGITLAVVYPHMNGVGGDSFWLIHEARRRTLRGLNAAGRSARSVTLDDYSARYGATVPARGGVAALTVPGAVSGWWEAHRYSRDVLASPIPWPALFEDAIAHAREGFGVSAGQRRVTAGAADLFSGTAPDEVRRTLWPIYHPDALRRDRLVQTDLAATLTSIATAGADDFYRGDLARKLTRAAREAGSPLGFEDFMEHRAEWVEPLRVRYRHGVAATLPPPTQGFAALAILSLLENFDVAAMDDADHVHVVVEATKLAFEDRDRYLTDPTAAEVPVERCLDPARLAERRSRISLRAALPADMPSRESDTIAVVAADGEGNTVSLIQSLYHEFGSGVVASGTGVILQNRGAFFSLDPGHPNRLAPRKHTATTLIPSTFLVNDRPLFAFGTMGGEGQPQTQAALVTRIIDRGLGPQAAVEAPRWLYGRTWGAPSKALRLEARFDSRVADTLRHRGHTVEVVEPWSDLMGHAQIVRLAPDGLYGGSDPRADGAALGW